MKKIHVCLSKSLWASLIIISIVLIIGASSFIVALIQLPNDDYYDYVREITIILLSFLCAFNGLLILLIVYFLIKLKTICKKSTEVFKCKIVNIKRKYFLFETAIIKIEDKQYEAYPLAGANQYSAIMSKNKERNAIIYKGKVILVD